MYYRLLHPFADIIGPSWEQGRIVLKIRLLWKTNPVNLFSKEQGLTSETTKNAFKNISSMVQATNSAKDIFESQNVLISRIGDRMNELITDEKLLRLIDKDLAATLSLKPNIATDFKKFIHQKKSNTNLGNEQTSDEQMLDDDGLNKVSAIAEEDSLKAKLVKKKQDEINLLSNRLIKAENDLKRIIQLKDGEQESFIDGKEKAKHYEENIFSTVAEIHIENEKPTFPNNFQEINSNEKEVSKDVQLLLNGEENSVVLVPEIVDELTKL